MPWITPTKNTLLKLRPIDSTKLEKSEVRRRNANEKLGVVAIRKAENNHWQVRLAGDLTIGSSKVRECYIWPGDWDGAAAALVASLDAARAKAVSMSAKAPLEIANGRMLDIAYKSQTDNVNNPSGSCNVTSSAICLEYWGIKGSGSGQLEDELYKWLESEGLSRHDPNHLKIAIEYYGCQDHFTTRATIPEIKKAIDGGTPVIVHGYFTTFGHIIVLIGYNDKGFICHDPWGEWTSSGYDRNNASNPIKGKGILYTYGLIERTCLPDGGCWAHFVTRAGFEKQINTAIAVVQPQSVNQNDVGGLMKRDEAMAIAIPEGCSRITPKQQTPLKAKPVMSGELSPEEKDSFDMDEAIIGVVSSAPSGHCLVTLPGTKTIKGRKTWFLFKDHVNIETPGGTSISSPGAKVTDEDYDRVAKMIGCEARALKAVVMVEAAGGGFLPSKRPKILFEAHWFSDFSNHVYDDSHPEISSRSWNPDLYDGGEQEWDRMEKAMKLNRSFAIQSASYGLPQIMGAYANEMPGLGFKDEEDFLTRMSRSEGDQLEAMGRFIMLDPRLVSAIRSKSWAKFAEAYNGESYAVNKYDIKLADAYASLG
jgi:uncharacterized protein YvpB